MYDISNFSGSKITSFSSQLSGMPLQRKSNNNCVMASGGVGSATYSNVLDDYRENRRFIKGSCLQDALAYQYNWFHCDSWSDRSNIPWALDTNQIDEGFPLNPGQTTYMFNVIAPASLVIWSLIETVRYMAVTPSGPVWDVDY